MPCKSDQSNALSIRFSIFFEKILQFFISLKIFNDRLCNPFEKLMFFVIKSNFLVVKGARRRLSAFFLQIFP
jgi:hypothetical protein